MFILDGKWSLKSAYRKDYGMVTVPGSVISGMIENGSIEDPYYGTNEYAVRDLMRKNYIFERDFELDKEPDRNYELVMDGVDTLADVYMNDVLICRTSNMHLQYKVGCTEYLHKGTNHIKLYFHSAVEYVENYKAPEGKEITYVNNGSMYGGQYIRKAHSMFGWDWGPQLPDMGIWRSIRITEVEAFEITDFRIRQSHENGVVRLDFATSLRDESADNYEIRYDITTPDGDIYHAEGDSYTVCNPMLWWPRGYGEQPLYTVTAYVLKDGREINSKSLRIGLRTLTVSRRADEWGREFAFCVNGVNIFAMGADYIPEDAIYQRINGDRIKSLIKDAVAANYNCIRVWGGGYYPSEFFYDMCDEAGLIVWQDMMFACNVYELNDEFKNNIVEEVKYNVRRIRHHASLGMWCGNNELESAWLNWKDYRCHSDLLKQDYLEIFEHIIPDAIRTEDDVTFYWPSSPSSGGGFDDPDSHNDGDVHYWGVWHGEEPYTQFEKCFFRFCSEFGFQSFPCVETIESFTEPSDRNVFSEVMESHQKNDAANGKILKYISANFLYPKDLESLVYVSQIMQALAIKAGVDHWRQNRGRSMGAVYWQMNDNWPVASWSSVDYYGRWKALHYFARRFFAGIAGTIKADGSLFTPYVQNETMKAGISRIHVYVKDMDFNILSENVEVIKTAALSVATGQTVDVSEYVKGRESEVYVEAVFEHSNGSTSRDVKMLKPYKYMKLPKSVIDYNVFRNGNTLTIELKADRTAFFVQIEIRGVKVVLSDNYFDITSDKTIVVTGEIEGDYDGIPPVKIISLCDTY